MLCKAKVNYYWQIIKRKCFVLVILFVLLMEMTMDYSMTHHINEFSTRMLSEFSGFNICFDTTLGFDNLFISPQLINSMISLLRLL